MYKTDKIRYILKIIKYFFFLEKNMKLDFLIKNYCLYFT